MIRIRASYTGRLLGNLKAYLASFQQNVNQTLDEVVQEFQPTILDELGYTPAERDQGEKLPWTSDLQRRAFFASNAFGAGIPFTRSGALPAGWIVTSQNGQMLIANSQPGAPFVYGSLSKSNPGKYQQLWLQAIGWQPAYETVYTWTAEVEAELVKRIDAQFGDMGNVNSSTRAYTRL